jgi:hypothetical protein
MSDDPVVDPDHDAGESGEGSSVEESGDASGAGEAGDGPATDDDPLRSDEFPSPAAEQSLVPAAAMKPLANAVVFVVVWSAMVVYTGRDLVTAVVLGLVAGSIYFLASYYLRS